MHCRVFLSALTLLCVSALAWSQEPFDWPQWQGPERNAISRETGLLKEWPEAGPPLAWRNDQLGGGYGAPSIASGRIYGMSIRGGDEVVWALAEKDGSETWVKALGTPPTGGMRQGREGPGCTPTVDGDRLYVLSMGGVLACLEAADGEIIWQKSLIGDFGGILPTWRYNESPLVEGTMLICTPGGSDATIVALDKSTGELVWKCQVPDASASGDGAGRGPDRGAERGGRAGRGRREPGARQSEIAFGQDKATPAAADPEILIPAGARWKYLDTGESPGEGWTRPEFRDAAWKEGAAQLGYGDGDEKTRISDARDSYPTYYFRLSFEVKDPASLEPLVLRLIRDDGAIVHVNGREVIRDGMPEGEVKRDTYAAGTAFSENEFHVHELSKDRLVAGRNVIAVEVHQASADSSDVSFDLELREKIAGDVVGPPPQRRRGGFGGFRGPRSGAAYASAIAIDVDGVRQIVQFTAAALVGVAASDGRLLWRYDRPSNASRINCSTPIYHDGLVFAASAYGSGGGAVRLEKKTDGTFEAKEVYFTPRMQNHHGGMIVVDGALYGANGGNSGGILACLDFQTGDVLWRDRQGPKGSLAMADGRLYLRAEEGTMVLVEPNREKLVERGRFEQPDRTRSPAWTHPVIANGKLYVRDQAQLFCYDVKAK